LRCGRWFFAFVALLALASCGAGDTTEDATNAFPVRVDRAVTSFLGGTVPPPAPVVETPPALPNARRPNLGDVPPRPAASSPEARYAALTELAQQRAEAQAEDRRLAATSPFNPDAQAAATDPTTAEGVLQPTPPISIGPGRSLASIVFDNNSVALREPQRQAVRGAAAVLASGGGPVRVIGFAGAGLPPQEAVAVARARAEAVAAELRAAGVAPARIQVVAPGSGSGRQVEIVVDL
jgi:outer membrane protein OmpA-like peptidoglycan-associated protein